jgi:hypothetical protein
MHHLTPLNFNGDLADPKFCRDLFVEETGDNPFHHLPLARGQ